MHTRLSNIIPTACLVAPVVASAQTTAATPDFGGSVLQVIISLIVVVLLLIGSLYLLKRLSAPRGVTAGLLRVIGTTAIGTRERVVLLEIADTWLVLGVAPGSVTSLHQMPRQSLPAVNATAITGRNFASRLKQVMSRRNAH